MNDNNEHSTNEQKPKIVLTELEGLKDFLDGGNSSNLSNIPELDEMIPVLNETIPVLDQEIPELTSEVEIRDNFKVSLDTEHSTETVEQQLSRTHHEQPKAPLEALSVVETSTEEVDESENDDSDLTDFTFTLVESNTDIVSTDSLVQQQYDLENNAQQQRSAVIELATADITTETLLDSAWVKVETLLMDNLPPQISGAFLELLNTQVDDNKQQLLNELELLDQDSLSELAGELDTDQGF